MQCQEYKSKWHARSFLIKNKNTDPADFQLLVCQSKKWTPVEADNTLSGSIWHGIRPLSLSSCLVSIIYSCTRHEKNRREKCSFFFFFFFFLPASQDLRIPMRPWKRQKWMPSNIELLLRILKSRLSCRTTIPSLRKVHLNENNRIWGQVSKTLSCRSTARYSHPSSLERSQPLKLCLSSKNCAPSGTKSRNQLFPFDIFYISFFILGGKKFFPPPYVKLGWKRA